MKKLFVLALLVFGGFLLYKNYGSFTANKDAFDDKGNPIVLVFTMDNCGAPCSDVLGDLRSKDIAFEEINIMTDEGRKRFEKYKERRLPLTVIGRQKIVGNNLQEIKAALAENYGMDALNGAEQLVMQNHFDEQGNPQVVMYGTSWCPYCKKMRAYFEKNSIPYTEIDVEASDAAKLDYETLKGRGYPLTYVGYRRIDGYDETRVSKAVKELLK